MFKKAFILPLLALFLSHCGSPLDPSRSNLKKPLSKAVALEKSCVQVAAQFPHTEGAASAWERFTPYEQAGLVKRANILQVADRAPNQHQRGRKYKAVKFELTELGTAHYSKINTGNMFQQAYGFCYASGKLENIHKISEVEVDYNRRKRLTAHYTYTLEPEKWFEEATKADDELSAQLKKESGNLSEKREGSKELFLTKTGWKLEDDIQNPDEYVLGEAPKRSMLPFGGGGGGSSKNGVGAWLQRFILGF